MFRPILWAFVAGYAATTILVDTAKAEIVSGARHGAWAVTENVVGAAHHCAMTTELGDDVLFSMASFDTGATNMAVINGRLPEGLNDVIFEVPHLYIAYVEAQGIGGSVIIMRPPDYGQLFGILIDHDITLQVGEDVWHLPADGARAAVTDFLVCEMRILGGRE